MASLKRTFGLFALFVYGLGDILGAGIYALIGKVASESGSYSWMSFAGAMVIAFLTAMSYAELTGRHPKSGGASYFAQQAFHSKPYAFIVGWLLLCVSVVSMATLARAFSGYTEGFELNISTPVIMACFFILLTLINLRGIKQSSWANILSTSIEVLGLIIVAYAGVHFLQNNDKIMTDNLTIESSEFSVMGVLQGAALAFYAFIGFEDLANIAEEVKKPERNLPIAILASLFTAGLFYIFIGWLSTSVIDPQQLAKSTNPMTDIVDVSGMGFPLGLFSVIALFAVSNTCLLNFITGSRLLYGMAKQELLPEPFEKVHEKYCTPFIAILSVAPVAFTLSIAGNLKFLAATTSVLILLVFCSTNISLIKIKKEEKNYSGFRVPVFIPWVALLSNIGLIFLSEKSSLLTAAGFLAAGALIYLALNAFYKKAEFNYH